MKIAVVGAGNMGLTYAQGMAKSDMVGKDMLVMMDVSEERARIVSETNTFQCVTELKECIPSAKVIFLAVKPFHAAELFKQMKPMVSENHIFVSVMAGVSIATIMDGLGTQKVIRSMPNLPAMVGEGVTSYTSSSAVALEDQTFIAQLLGTTGLAVQVESEKFIDASTGISGSGPAYVFYFMKALMDAGVKMGFSEQVARDLMTQTFKGAVTVFEHNEHDLQTWMDMVTSKGGTTFAALESMKSNHVAESIIEGAFAAFARAQELGKEGV